MILLQNERMSYITIKPIREINFGTTALFSRQLYLDTMRALITTPACRKTIYRALRQRDGILRAISMKLLLAYGIRDETLPNSCIETARKARVAFVPPTWGIVLLKTEGSGKAILYRPLRSTRTLYRPLLRARQKKCFATL